MLSEFFPIRCHFPKLGNISFNELNELLFRAGRHRYSSYTYIFTHSRQELSRLAKAKTED
jgi:hypothetical protein